MLPITFNVRQAGCCMTAARIIAGKLLKEGKSPVVVEGWIQFVDEEHRGADLRFAHTWVELDGELLDPTLEQFSEYLDFYSFEREYQEVLPASDYLADLRLNTDTPEVFFRDGHIPADCQPYLMTTRYS